MHSDADLAAIYALDGDTAESDSTATKKFQGIYHDKRSSAYGTTSDYERADTLHIVQNASGKFLERSRNDGRRKTLPHLT